MCSREIDKECGRGDTWCIQIRGQPSDELGLSMVHPGRRREPVTRRLVGVRRWSPWWLVIESQGRCLAVDATFGSPWGDLRITRHWFKGRREILTMMVGDIYQTFWTSGR